MADIIAPVISLKVVKEIEPAPFRQRIIDQIPGISVRSNCSRKSRGCRPRVGQGIPDADPGYLRASISLLLAHFERRQSPEFENRSAMPSSPLDLKIFITFSREGASFLSEGLLAFTIIRSRKLSSNMLQSPIASSIVRQSCGSFAPAFCGAKSESLRD